MLDELKKKNKQILSKSWLSTYYVIGSGEMNRCGLCPHKAESEVGNLTMEK